MTNHVLLIIKREYLTRVRRKSFIITTLLFPLIFVAMMALPTVFAGMSGPSCKHIAVVDETAYISKAFLDDEMMHFEISDKDVESLKLRNDLDAILVIPADIVDNPGSASLYTNGALTPQTEIYISQLLSHAIEQEKLSSYNIEGLEDIIRNVKTDVNLNTYRTDGDSEKTSSSIASYIIGMLLTLILYMLIMLYGQMVMTSVIEEKNNRVLELVVSSVKPTSLMLGKIIGIGAVALTQLAIWTCVIGIFSVTFMPSLLTNALTSGADLDLIQLMSSLGDTGYLMGLFGTMAIFLVLGYLFYSSMYAAIGSAVDNVQDATQLQIFALLPILLGMVFSMSILNDPGSSLAITLSLIPLTSPEVMMGRIAFGVPGWQMALSIVILVVSIVFMIWLSARIYRIGIFMYGKKPSVREMLRWARYK